MNKNLAKSFSIVYLLYCTIFSVAIMIAGITQGIDSKAIFFQILFLPVIIFFVLALFSKVSGPKNKESGAGELGARESMVFYTVVIIIFLASLFLSFIRVMDSQKSSTIHSPLKTPDLPIGQ